MTQFQKNAINHARAEGQKLRDAVEKLTPADLDNLYHLHLATRITNLIYDVEKAMKTGRP